MLKELHADALTIQTLQDIGVNRLGNNGRLNILLLLIFLFIHLREYFSVNPYLHMLLFARKYPVS